MKKMLILVLVLAISSLGYAWSDDFSSYSDGDDVTVVSADWSDFGGYSASISTDAASGSYSSQGSEFSGRPRLDIPLNASNNVLTVHINLLALPNPAGGESLSFQMREEDGGGNYAVAAYLNSTGNWKLHAGDGGSYEVVGAAQTGWQTLVYTLDFAAQTYTWTNTAGNLSYSGAINFDAGEPDITEVHHTRFYSDMNYYMDYASITPEPMTIALLGLGGLFLRRRK